jgi:hypothetical protein
MDLYMLKFWVIDFGLFFFVEKPNESVDFVWVFLVIKCMSVLILGFSNN